MPLNQTTVNTASKPLRFLFVCDTDSQLYACRSLAEDLTDLGHACTFAILGEGKDLPSDLRRRQFQEFPQTRETTWDGLLADLNSLEADAVGVYLSGSQIHSFLQQAKRSCESHKRRVFFCGFNGLVYEKFEEGISWRLGYDIVCLNSLRDKDNFDQAFGRTKYAAQRIAIIGLNRGRNKTDNFALLPFEQRPKLAVFAEQVKVPKSKTDRLFLLRKMADLAERNKDWNIVIKPRVRPEERTFHRVSSHPEHLLNALGNCPPNLTLTYTPLPELLARTRVLMTVSSTAMFEAIYYGCQPIVLTDFGVVNSFGSHVFLGSGLETQADSIKTLNSITPRAPNHEWARYIGLDSDLSVRALVESVSSIRRHSQNASGRVAQMPLRSPFFRASSLIGGDNTADSVQIACRLWKEGSTDQALYNLEALRKRAPENSRCRRLLAELYIQRRNYAASAACLAEAFLIRPENQRIRRRLQAVLSKSAPLRAIRLAISTSYKPEHLPAFADDSSTHKIAN
jgi:hypothetical protein